jgi:hypothetical protein
MAQCGKSVCSTCFFSPLLRFSPGGGSAPPPALFSTWPGVSTCRSTCDEKMCFDLLRKPQMVLATCTIFGALTATAELLRGHTEHLPVQRAALIRTFVNLRTLHKEACECMRLILTSWQADSIVMPLAANNTHLKKRVSQCCGAYFRAGDRVRERRVRTGDTDDLLFNDRARASTHARI